jgi:hypothetical protein
MIHVGGMRKIMCFMSDFVEIRSNALSAEVNIFIMSMISQNENLPFFKQNFIMIIEEFSGR